MLGCDTDAPHLNIEICYLLPSKRFIVDVIQTAMCRRNDVTVFESSQRKMFRNVAHSERAKL